VHHHIFNKHHYKLSTGMTSLSPVTTPSSFKDADVQRQIVGDNQGDNTDINEVHTPLHPPTPPTTSPFLWLTTLSEYGVILCTNHQRCYTPRNIREHLLRGHSVFGERYKAVEAWIQTQNIAPEVREPADGSPFIHGLQFTEGFVCSVDDQCHVRTASKQGIQRHCSATHGV
jgi:hypothetical protein